MRATLTPPAADFRTGPASTLIELLNSYFMRMSKVVVDEAGLVNKDGCDSLLAVFGSPLNPSQPPM